MLFRSLFHALNRAQVLDQVIKGGACSFRGVCGPRRIRGLLGETLDLLAVLVFVVVVCLLQQLLLLRFPMHYSSFTSAFPVLALAPKAVALAMQAAEDLATPTTTRVLAHWFFARSAGSGAWIQLLLHHASNFHLGELKRTCG